MFGINGSELIVILVLAVVIVGPTRLPQYAKQLKRWVGAAKRMLADARVHVEREMGENSIDWNALDPRQFDPRRIVNDAFAEADSGAPSGSGTDANSGPHRVETGPPMPPSVDAEESQPSS